MHLLKSLSIVSGMTILSRITGFLREIIVANFLGAGAITDCLALSIKIPAFFRRIFAEGAFHASFVPVYMKNLDADLKKAERFSNLSFSFLCTSLFLLVVFMEFCIPAFVQTFLTGLDPIRQEYTILFTRITFPFIFFIALTAFYSSLLNSHGHFTAASSSAAAGNIFIIAFIWTVSRSGLGFAWAVVLSGIVQMLWVWFPMRRHKFHLTFNVQWIKNAAELQPLFKTLWPAALSAGVVQANLLIGMWIASYLPTGNLSYLHFADRLQQLPLSIIGTAIGTALLPLLTQQIQHNPTSAERTHMLTYECALLLTIPASLGLIFLAHPIIFILFEHGRFTSTDTMHTAYALQAYATGLPAYVLFKVFSVHFFAHQDTRRPLIASAFGVISDVVLSFICMQFMGHVGIALASSLAGWVSMGTLIFFYIKKHQSCSFFNVQILYYTVRAFGVFILILILGRFICLHMMHSSFLTTICLICTISSGILVFLYMLSSGGYLTPERLEILRACRTASRK